MFPSPTRMFLTKGIGVHRHALTAFEFALRDADIEQQNLVYVSSILPPHCEVISREAGGEILKPGDITFCVLARSETNEFGRRIYASLGLARPSDPNAAPRSVRRTDQRTDGAPTRRLPPRAVASSVGRSRWLASRSDHESAH